MQKESLEQKVMMLYKEKYTAEQIAKRLSVNINTVKRILEKTGTKDETKKWAGGVDSTTFNDFATVGNDGSQLTSEMYPEETKHDGLAAPYPARMSLSREKMKKAIESREQMLSRFKTELKTLQGKLNSEHDENKKDDISDKISMYEDRITQLQMKSMNKEILPVDRPEQGLYNIKRKDVLERTKELLEQMNDIDLVKRTIHQEFGVSESEVNEIIAPLLSEIDPDKNEGRKLDPAANVMETTKSVGNFKDAYFNRGALPQKQSDFKKKWFSSFSQGASEK
jgi:hypothetical protein